MAHVTITRSVASLAVEINYTALGYVIARNLPCDACNEEIEISVTVNDRRTIELAMGQQSSQVVPLPSQDFNGVS